VVDAGQVLQDAAAVDGIGGSVIGSEEVVHMFSLHVLAEGATTTALVGVGTMATAGDPPTLMTATQK
jgi:hypothetical protein